METDDRRYVPLSWFYSGVAHQTLVNAVPELRDRERRYPLPTIANVVILVAFQAEAMINEIAYWLHVHPTYARAMPGAVFERRTNVLEKWQIVPKACGAPGLSNDLAHPRAYPDAQRSVLDVLRARGCLQNGSDWFERTMSIATAKWAMNTALAMAERLRTMLLPHVPVNEVDPEIRTTA